MKIQHLKSIKPAKNDTPDITTKKNRHGQAQRVRSKCGQFWKKPIHIPHKKVEELTGTVNFIGTVRTIWCLVTDKLLRNAHLGAVAAREVLWLAC